MLATDTREVEDLELGTRWRCTLLGCVVDSLRHPGPADSYDLVMCLGGGPFAVLKLREGELRALDDGELVRRIEQELRARDTLPSLTPTGAE